MPSNFLYIDTNFPTFTGEETSEEQIDSMLNYLHILVEQLRYTLNNLDMTNFNSKAISDWSDASTEDIQQELVTIAAQLNQVNQNVAGLARRVGNLESLETRVADTEDTVADLVGRMTDAEDRVDIAEDDIDALEGRATTTEGNVSNLQERMTTAEGNISNLQGRMTAAEGGVAAAVADIEALQQATLDQQQDIIDLAGEDTAQKRRIAALELWKDGTNNNGAAADIDALKADSNTQASDIAELKLWRDGTNNNGAAAAISGLQTDVQNIGNDVSTLIAEMAQLKTSISVAQNGDAVFGKTGQRTDIKGNVYVNGLPYVSGGST
jgi:chromosome segregation ATPase